MFPFTQISDDELHYLSVGIYDNLIDIYDNCSGLNYEPFKCSETKEYFTTDKIDPDNNVHNKNRTLMTISCDRTVMTISSELTPKTPSSFGSVIFFMKIYFL